MPSHLVGTQGTRLERYLFVYRLTDDIDMHLFPFGTRIIAVYNTSSYVGEVVRTRFGRGLKNATFGQRT